MPQSGGTSNFPAPADAFLLLCPLYHPPSVFNSAPGKVGKVFPGWPPFLGELSPVYISFPPLEDLLRYLEHGLGSSLACGFKVPSP